MKDYLTGYLDIVPEAEKARIKSILQNNSETMSDLVSENEFAELIRRIAEDHEQQSEFVEMARKLDEKLYNKFFSKVQLDLNAMFSESGMIEQAISNYDRLYDGILADLQKEIKSLKEKIEVLRLVAEGEDGLIIRTFDFQNNSGMETDRQNFGYLFTDRDGSSIIDCEITKDSTSSYMSLAHKTSTDKLRDQDGKTVASLAVKDYRGVAEAKDGYSVSNAIDSSSETYWAEIVLVDEPVNVGMDGFAGGGAMVQFTVTLPRPEIVSEISLTPFTTYPLEIVSIKYEEDTETYHLPVELIKAKTEGTQSILVQFPSVVAKRFTFIMRQKNYTKNVYTVREQEMHKADLWDKIKKREVEVTLNNPSAANATVSQTDLDTYSGWDIYQQELEKYNKEYQKFVEALAAYKAQWG